MLMKVVEFYQSAFQKWF